MSLFRNGYVFDGLRALWASIRNVPRPVFTEEYPEYVRPRPERYRASFALLHEADGDEACIGCLQCERICPSQVISIKPAGKRDSKVTGKKRGYADDFMLDLNACIYCELCVQVCPTDAIVMVTEPEVPAFGREDLVLTMARLYDNETKRRHSWATGSSLMEMQAAPKPPPAAPAAAAPLPGPNDKPPAGGTT